MQQSDEYTPTGAHVSALTSVVQTLLAHVLTLEPTQGAADALVARQKQQAMQPGLHARRDVRRKNSDC